MDVVSTWDDLVKQKAQDEANLPMCECCKGKVYVARHKPYEPAEDWGEGGIARSPVICDDCDYGCNFTFGPFDIVLDGCGAFQSTQPQPVPENQAVMF